MSERTDPPELVESTRRWIYAGLILMGLFIAVFPIYRFYEPAQRADAREEQAAFLADEGADLFDGDCSGCHGVEGRGGIAPAIGSKEFLESVEDDQIEQLISLGVPGTEMVSYSIDFGGPLTAEEIKAVTAYLRSLEVHAESNALWRTPLAASDLFGDQLFAMACARCHGIDRKGTEDVAPDISATSFAMEETDEWLAGRIRDGYKNMPRFGGILNEEQIQVIVSFLRGVVTNTTTTTTTTSPPTGPTTTAAPGTPTTTEAPDGNAELLELGRQIFEGEVFVGEDGGCAACHGIDAQGDVGPNIIGTSKSSISGALGGGIIDMERIKLSPEQLDAVYAWIRYLTENR